MDFFTQAYIECLLWSENDADDEPLDACFSIADFSDEALKRIQQDCEDFQNKYADLLAKAYELYEPLYDYTPQARAGHDFWLTRQGHGAGFWDRNLEEIGDELTMAAKSFGELYPYVGDDGKIYL